ncbi:type II secretion system protein [Massilia aurea]|uniref:type II secretion system protein n=1 Tax=Massilia aurea TaxID=373040 RepID=UPI003462753C
MTHPGTLAGRGFTLIELLVTLAILGLLGTLVLPVAEVTVQRRDEQELRRGLREIRTGLDAYKKAADEGRVAKAADASGYPARLELLVQGVPDLRSPKQAKIYFMRRLPRDPFSPGRGVDNADDGATWGKRSYASEPDQPQEGDDVYDVYSRSERVGLNGIPYNKW